MVLREHRVSIWLMKERLYHAGVIGRGFGVKKVKAVIARTGSERQVEAGQPAGPEDLDPVREGVRRKVV